MGQQLNKVQKRRRRQDYLERKKLKAKEATVTKSKTRRTTKKAEATPAAE